MRAPRTGFSALELLAAFTLILIGASILSVYCQKARDAARTAACTSNIKQLALAARMYSLDCGGRLPPSPTEFAASLEPYAKNQQILVCPADSLAGRARERGEPGSSPATVSYLMNPNVGADDEPSTVILGDNVPNRHRGGRWIGARLDGATRAWPAGEWETRLGWVIRNATPNAE